MSRVDSLKEKIESLYRNGSAEGAADWAEYMLQSHVFVVGVTAGEMAKRFGANKELATSVGIL